MNAPEIVFTSATVVTEHLVFTEAPKKRLQNAMEDYFSSGDQRIDVSKNSILRLREWSVKSLQGGREELEGIALDNVEVYWDGYIRAIDHILEMENE